MLDDCFLSLRHVSSIVVDMIFLLARVAIPIVW
jgi:hypothetical protein